jgi:hypothetical protein
LKSKTSYVSYNLFTYLLEESQRDETEATKKDNLRFPREILFAIQHDSLEKLKEAVEKGILFRNECHIFSL